MPEIRISCMSNIPPCKCDPGVLHHPPVPWSGQCGLLAAVVTLLRLTPRIPCSNTTVPGRRRGNISSGQYELHEYSRRPAARKPDHAAFRFANPLPVRRERSHCSC